MKRSTSCNFPLLTSSLSLLFIYFFLSTPASTLFIPLKNICTTTRWKLSLGESRFTSQLITSHITRYSLLCLLFLSLSSFSFSLALHARHNFSSSSRGRISCSLVHANHACSAFSTGLNLRPAVTRIALCYRPYSACTRSRNIPR